MENTKSISDNGEASASPSISSQFGENSQPPEFDPYDVENLRLDPSYLSQPAAKKLLTVIPVKRPHRQSFIRVHPGEEYRLFAAVLELHENRESFLVLPQFTASLGEGEYYAATLFLYVTRQGVPGIWPAKMPDPDGRQNMWHTSALDAAERAMKSWLRVVPNMGKGAYEIVQATDKLSEPQWPEQSFSELLRIAFKDRIIDRRDHLIIQKLRDVAGSHDHFMLKSVNPFPDLDALRLTPEQAAELQKSQKSQKSKQLKKGGIQWYLFPARVLDAVGKVCRQNHTPAPLILTLVLCEIRFKSFGQNPIKLTTAALAKFNISGDQKLRALKLLEETGHFTVMRQHGKNPIVRMNWLPAQN